MSLWKIAAFALFCALVVLLIDIIKFIIRTHISRKQAKQQAIALDGSQILAARLKEQRQQQLRHIKEREAADQHILDQAEEARRDFE